MWRGRTAIGNASSTRSQIYPVIIQLVLIYREGHRWEMFMHFTCILLHCLPRRKPAVAFCFPIRATWNGVLSKAFLQVMAVML